MSPFAWVKALELNRWADSVPARGLLPQLMRTLIHATVEKKDIQHIHFPANEETHRPGFDGETKISEGNAWVPPGITYWQMGTNSGVKAKLDDDYKIGLQIRGEGDFGKATYIAITPRDFQQKKDWAEEKYAEGKWGHVRVYDSADFEEWLEYAPAVAQWLAQYASTSPGGTEDVLTRWKTIQSALKKNLPADVLLVGRENISQRFKEWIDGRASILSIVGQSPREIVDVFSAWVSKLPEKEQEMVSSRALIVDNVDSWRGLSKSREGLILICGEQLEIDERLISEAQKSKHHILQVGLQSPDSIHLDRLNRNELEIMLRNAGLAEREAALLSQQSGGSFTILSRRYSGVPLHSKPAWGAGQEAIELTPLLLAGAWSDSNTADQNAIVKLTGKEYPCVKQILTKWRNASDSPVRWINNAWEFVSPLDAWSFLSCFLNSDYLDAFEVCANSILGADDPRLDLPREDRWLANIKGKELPNSGHLRQGISRTMALLATTDVPGLADSITLQARIDRIVRTILPQNSSWKKWASLGYLLPAIAEASPDSFLLAAESSLRGENCEFKKLLAEEGSTFTGRAEHTGLLWGLERLSWSPDYLSRTATILAKLAEIDTGGKWANRPKASLRDIFFSRLPRTSASVDQRLNVLQQLLHATPNAGWQLLVDLLPMPHQGIALNNAPEWRFWSEYSNVPASLADFQLFVDGLLELTLSHVELHHEKLVELLPRISGLSQNELVRVANSIDRISQSNLSPELRFQLWMALRELTLKHRSYSGTKWAQPPQILGALEAIRDKLQPSDAVDLATPLFTPGFNMIEDSSLSWEARETLRSKLRIESLKEVVQSQGLSGVLKLVRAAKDVFGIAAAFFGATGSQFESQIIPSLLCDEVPAIENFARIYAACRINALDGREWAESLPSSSWSATQVGSLVSQLPLDNRTWNFVRGLGETVEAEYWRKTASYRPGFSAGEVTFVARKLIAAGRPSSAIDLLAMTVGQENTPPAKDILELIESGLKARIVGQKHQIDLNGIALLLQEIQKSSDVPLEKLSRLEWILLPALDGSGALPKTLHKALSDDPAFFVELLTLLYRRNDGGEDTDEDTGLVPERNKQNMERAWELIREWRRLPGTRDDGTIDGAALKRWIQTARALATAKGRVAVCDISIGTVLSYSLADSNGMWPCEPVREVLEQIDTREILNGFATGVQNQRSAYWKSPYEGGRQERELAEKYEGHAKASRDRWPRTAAALKQVAQSYHEHARRADQEAEAEK